MRWGAVPVLLAFAGCDLGLGSDPYAEIELDPCLPGTARGVLGPGCVAVSTTISPDGFPNDWDGLVAGAPVIDACTSVDCDGLLATTVQSAITPGPFDEPELAIRVRLAGGAAPIIDDPAVRYRLELRPTPEYPGEVTVALEAGPDGARWLYAGVDPFPPGTPTIHRFAWLPDGYEMTVPLSFVPLAGGAIVAPLALRGDVVVNAPSEARTCWVGDPLGKDPCALR